jgi:hypothetical protein
MNKLQRYVEKRAKNEEKQEIMNERKKERRIGR